MTSRSVPRSRGHFVSLPRIINEKTIVQPVSRLCSMLEIFYTEVAHIQKDVVQTVQKRTRKVMDVLLPRLRVNKLDFTFAKEPIYTGSNFDNTAVVSPTDADVLLPFDKGKTEVELLELGYVCVLPPPRKRRKSKVEELDKLKFARTDDNQFVSPIKINKAIYKVIEHALRFPVEIPGVYLQPFDPNSPTPYNIALLVNKLRINIVPTIVNEDRMPWVITRPYQYDENPSSDMLWRFCNQSSEDSICDSIGRADRGCRHKAFLILKALFRVEATLRGINSYHLKTVLFHSMAHDVDSSPRWQRDDVASCFTLLLRTLSNFLRARYLPDFFIDGFNLLENMEPRMLTNLSNRVAHIAGNESELMRLLRKRRK